MLLPSYTWRVIWRDKIMRRVGKDGVNMNETDKKWVHFRASNVFVTMNKNVLRSVLTFLDIMFPVFSSTWKDYNTHVSDTLDTVHYLML